MTTRAQQARGSAPPPAEPPNQQARQKPDVRYLALRNFAVSLTVFNILGYAVLGFEQPWIWPLFALATGYTAEIVLETIAAWAEKRPPRFRGKGPRGLYEFLLPAHITSLAVNMLLYANDQWWPVMFGIVVAIGGKYVFRAPVNGRLRHFMNPSNLGITATVLAFGAWVSIAPPYQFTEYANTFFRLMIPLVLITAGTVINALLTGRIMLIAGWMGTFTIQALVRHWIWHVALFTAFGAMSGVAFILFTNYMITDPGTSPSRGRAQFMFGSSIAVVYAVLMLFNVTYTLFYATTIVCAFRGLGLWGIHWRKLRRERIRPAASLFAEVVSSSA